MFLRHSVCTVYEVSVRLSCAVTWCHLRPPESILCRPRIVYNNNIYLPDTVTGITQFISSEEAKKLLCCRMFRWAPPLYRFRQIIEYKFTQKYLYTRCVAYNNNRQHYHCPSLTIDNIWAMMFVWREDYQNCSVLYCVLKLCTVIDEQFLQFFGLSIVTLGPFHCA